MEFISNLAGARISLPEYPHIPEEFLDEYLSEISENPDNINEEKYYKRIKEEL